TLGEANGLLEVAAHAKLAGKIAALEEVDRGIDRFAGDILAGDAFAPADRSIGKNTTHHDIGRFVARMGRVPPRSAKRDAQGANVQVGDLNGNEATGGKKRGKGSPRRQRGRPSRLTRTKLRGARAPRR